ncbi:MAG: PfkB family carbohydrate kinase [Methylomonas sp.]|nr:PfkB family carbohydrate kinase [Methylomonas sp.]
MSNKQIQIFGEVLFDHFPDGSCVLGGAPFNVAWHLQAFGQKSYFISRVGRDETGDVVRQAMLDWRMMLSGLQQDIEHPTGAVQISMQSGEPSYAIVPEQAYDFINAGQLPGLSHDGLLYHGTLAARHEVSRQALSALKRWNNGLVFMDVNLREPWWHRDEVLALADEADWVKLNHHELQVLQAESADLNDAMQQFLEIHRLQGLVVTRGDRGASALDASGDFIEVAPAETQQVVDTVGAGDAFASVLLLGIQLNWPLRQTLDRAQSFASALVGRRGATVSDRAFYTPFISSWRL